MSEMISRMVKEHFGEGNFLVNHMLDDKNKLRITPVFNNLLKPPGISIDGRIAARKLKTGEPALSLGIHSLIEEPFKNYDGVFLIAVPVKKSGTVLHTLPKNLRALIPLVQAAANHQFSVSKKAIDKIAILTFRHLPVSTDYNLIADTHWHVHTQDNMPEKFNQMGLSAEAAHVEKVDPGAIVNEYTWSGFVPTLVQSERDIPGVKPAAIPQGIVRDTAPPHRQLAEFEMAMMNSFCFHKAPDSNDDKRITGKPVMRPFFHLTYMELRP